MASDRKISRPIRDVAPPASAPKRKLDVDSLLTPETKARIKAEAEAKIKAREIAAAEEEYLQQQMSEFDKARHPEIVEEMRELRLDLPQFMTKIVLDGVEYYHGGNYKLRRSVFDVIRDITQHAFNHDDEINNRRNSNAYRNERQLRMNASTGELVDSTGRPAAKF